MNGASQLHAPLYQPQLLVQGLSRDLDRTLLHPVGGEPISARAFRDMVSRYGQALVASGARRGSRIGVLSANRPEVLVITAACLVNGHILVPMHPAGSLDDHLHVLEDAAIELLAFDPDRFAEHAAALSGSATPCSFLSLGPCASGSDLSVLADSMAAAPLVAPQIDPDEPYRFSYTGGTTGKPKAIVGTHRTGRAVVEIQMASWEWPSQVRQLVCAPLSHAGAAMFLPTLLRGGSMIILPDFDPVKVMEAIEYHRITCVMLVPTMIYALMDHPRFGEYDLSSLETVFYGASSILPSRLKEAIGKFGPVFFQFYGQAEAPMTISVMRRDEHDIEDPLRLASCGRPVPWLTVALLDENLAEVPEGEPGEICVRGPLVMERYHDRPAQTAEALAGGWLHSGDIAVRDAKGFLRIVDRKKDMIITGGFNVYPREVEDALASHPAVATCAVVGIPDDRWGEAVTAVVVPRAGEKPVAAELIALVRERKGPIQAPKTIHFATALPLTSLGKIDKKRLRAELAAAAWELNDA
uniref:Long-chain-fatty-acid--CoA ligase n=1 Tax=Sphingomonas sp. JE1 TaxID=1628059 RepID=A0A0D5A030_9SPHN|nr:MULTISPECIES: AMP-binding protein [unclassified Sphingomonas]AJW29538.1 Long-chain-fatty-acid--CoA ligase [Sphingomonas sp. JE1]